MIYSTDLKVSLSDTIVSERERLFRGGKLGEKLQRLYRDYGSDSHIKPRNGQRLLQRLCRDLVLFAGRLI